MAGNLAILMYTSRVSGWAFNRAMLYTTKEKVKEEEKEALFY